MIFKSCKIPDETVFITNKEWLKIREQIGNDFIKILMDSFPTGERIYTVRTFAETKYYLVK